MNDNLEKMLAPSKNGVIKIGKKGRLKFQFDEAFEPFEVDAVAVFDAWFEVDWALREADGSLPNNKLNEHGQNRLAFVQGIINDAYAAMGVTSPPVISRGEAEAFIVEILKEVQALRDFFSPKKDEPGSSPGTTEVRFSQ